jgi:transposase
MPFPAAPPLSVSVSDRATLRAIARAPTSEQRAVTRARIVLRSAEAVAIERIAAELGVAVMTVKLWRRRYSEQGLIGLVEEHRSGRPPTYTREDRDRVIAFTLSEPPPGTTHWSARRLGERLGMSETTVWRIWRSANLEAPPRRDVQVEHRSGARGQGARRRGALPRAARAGDRVERRWEDLRSEALDRTQPMLPLRPGQVERHTHDDTRHGVTSLFAALNVATGEVTQESRQRHTGADFLAFLRRIERAYRARTCMSCLTTSAHTRRPPCGHGSSVIRG